MIKQILIVGLGGGCGSILRYLTSVITARYYTQIFPLSTLIVNVAGCILIGFFIGISDRSQLISPDLKLLLITGFCGGYTTFSTFSSESLFLFSNGFYWMLIGYTLSSVILGFSGVFLGTFLAKTV